MNEDVRPPADLATTIAAIRYYRALLNIETSDNPSGDDKVMQDTIWVLEDMQRRMLRAAEHLSLL